METNRYVPELVIKGRFNVCVCVVTSLYVSRGCNDLWLNPTMLSLRHTHTQLQFGVEGLKMSELRNEPE